MTDPPDLIRLGARLAPSTSAWGGTAAGTITRSANQERVSREWRATHEPCLPIDDA